MNYNKFRIWVGRILGILFLVFIPKRFNFDSLMLMAVGHGIRIWAAGYIHKNHEVTMSGPYKLLRHPLYLGNFIVGLGFALFVNMWQLITLYILVFFIVYYKKMELEEQYLLDEFGEKYNKYQETTMLFVPNLFNIFKEDNGKFSWRNVVHNREHLNLLGSVVVIVIFLLYQNIITGRQLMTYHLLDLLVLKW